MPMVQININAAKKNKNKGNKSVTIEQLDATSDNLIGEVGNYGIYLINNGSNHIDENTNIYRYTSLNNLYSILNSGKMHVSNIKGFTDSIEANGLLEAALDERLIREIDSHWVKQWKERIRKTSLVCASCWTLDKCDDEDGVEQFLMWKAYGGGENCCRIGTTIGQLAKSIRKTRYDIVIGDMVYGGEPLENNYKDYIFHKTKYYKSEQEIRIAVLCINAQGTNLKVDCNKLFLSEFPDKTKISSITISPFLSPILSGVILSYIRKRLPNVKVDRSAIKEYEYLEYLTDREKRVNGERI